MEKKKKILTICKNILISGKFKKISGDGDVIEINVNNDEHPFTIGFGKSKK